MIMSLNVNVSHESAGVCGTLLRLYTSTEHLKRVYTCPGPLLEICYITLVMVLNIISTYIQFLSKTHLNKKNFWDDISVLSKIFLISVYDC
jgi:hypothetical protein